MDTKIVHQSASIKKRVFALLIDYFLIAIGNVFFYFLIVSQIANKLPIMESFSTNFYNAYDSMKTIIEESRLDSLNNETYIKMCVKTSLGEDYFYGTNYQEVSTLTKSNDPFYYYLNVYKVNNSENYIDEGFTYDNFKDSLINSGMFTVLDIDYYALKYEVAIKIGDYLFNNNLNLENSYTVLENLIKEQFFNATNDLKTNNKKYIINNDTLNNTSNSIRGANFLEINISFFLSFLLIYLLPILINKKHKSLGLIALKLYPESNKKSRKISLFLKIVSSFFLTYSSIFFSLFLTSGNSYGQILILDINGFFIVMALLIFFVLLSLFSLTLEFIPFTKCSLSDYISSTKIKDEMLVEKNEDNN